MDLAKIRKKYQKSPAVDSAVCYKQNIQTTAPAAMPISESATEASISQETDFFDGIISETAPQVTAVAFSPIKNSAYLDPIEIILAGRSAAGCNEESPDDEELSTFVSENCLEYLCFRVSDEIYGINIMDIKEIIKPREVTEIPRAPEFVSGIISLRGTIIPIIDMRSRLGLLSKNATGKERVVVIKNNQSYSGLFVDEVIQVIRINKENMEPAPLVLEGINRDFVSGIGRSEGRLIIILNIESIVDIQLF